ncbi:MAG: RNA polymerase factor sigma-32 [Candidatus Calescibacterium sp.]|nr:RNA polymerase factor sigma-32 [Candidatus Calescibacterium sp.]MCX7734303.1 RNA polymerase factor sigma-32 [bacterium]MDW8087135.1 RNA polymerase factor sigma-32 [Candidatus Calescibacterium sp.]
MKRKKETKKQVRKNNGKKVESRRIKKEQVEEIEKGEEKTNGSGGIEDILSQKLKLKKSPDIIKKGNQQLKENLSKTPFAYLLKEVSKYPLLSPEEERKLAIRFKKYGDREAAKRLVLANLRFVIKIALDYKNWGVPVEDLVSEGIVGLLNAMKKFDPNKGVKFISYASYWIKAFIHNYILSNFSIIKLGTTQDERKIFANIFKIREESFEEDIKEQVKKLGVDEEKIKLMSSRVRARDISLENPQDEEGSLKLADILKADESYEPITRVELEDSRDFIQSRLNDVFLHLTSQERQVIQQRYLSPRPKTLKELSDELKISKERIRQVEKRAFQKLRTILSKYAKTFRIDMLKDKVRRKRRTKEEMELARMIQGEIKQKKRRKRRSITKIEPKTTEFFDLKDNLTE